MQQPNPPLEHNFFDDAQGISLGVFLAGVGLHLLTTGGLITGQSAGVAVILSYLTGYSFGVIFFLVNLPFYVLAWKRLGPLFTIKSLISVTLLSVVTGIIPLGMVFETLDPLVGTLVFGVTVGLGLLACFRHKGSLGGIGVIGLMVQDRTGFKAGYVQLLVDVAIFAVALFMFPMTVVAYSLLGAVVLNGVIAFNHRRDRYIAS